MTKKQNSWEEIPWYEGLVASMIDTYKSRKKNWNELPIILYFIYYNNCIEAGWLSRIVLSKTTLAPAKLPTIFRPLTLTGEVAEWSKAHAWNACRRETLSRVRIPVSPPENSL